MGTISEEIIAALANNPGKHDGKELYVLVRQRVEGLSHSSFRSRLSDLVIEGKVVREGARGKYLNFLP